MSNEYRPREEESLEAEVGEVVMMLSGNDMDILRLLDEDVNGLHQVSKQMDLASKTVEKAYNRLNGKGFLDDYSGEGDFNGKVSKRGRDALWISENVMSEDRALQDLDGFERLKVVNTTGDQIVFEGGSFYEPGKNETFREGEYALVRPTGEKNLGLDVVEVEEYPVNYQFD